MKTNTWQLQEAKNHFSEVVSQACAHGAQTITKHGKPVAVVVGFADFQNQPKPSAQKKPSLYELLRSCPYPELATHVEQSRKTKDYGRTLNLDR
ncbi:MAG: type II toxin-antitoxin system Phd/YefM family antitoxin [Planctomycetaceae bacterium]|nr:type II toxin-antitoxin system Phd/YefM family antitoxin [Planctomycetaceae bacterium]